MRAGSTKPIAASTKRSSTVSSRDAGAARPGDGPAGRDQAPDLGDAGLARQWQRPGQHELGARVLGRVVAGGDLRPGIEVPIGDGEVDHLGRRQPQLGHVRAGLDGAVGQRVGDAGRRQAHVVPDRDPRGLEARCRGADNLDEAAPEVTGTRLVDLARVEARARHRP